MTDFTWTVPSGMQAVTPSGLVIARNADLTAVQQVPAGAVGTKTATSSLTAAPRGYLAMTMGLAVAGSGAVNPDPDPDPVTPSTEYKSIRFVNGSQASAWFQVDSVNPTATSNPAGADYPGYRGPGQLIVISNPPTSTTATNEWGVEVQVGSDDVVDAINDRQATADTNGTSVPSGGYVISGHDAARQYLLGAAQVGWTVELSYELPPTVTPGPDPTPNPTPTGPYPSKVVSIYKMMWSVNGPNIGSIPSGCNEIRLSFLQGDPPSQVGWGSQGQSSALADIASKVAAGTRFIWSIGGAGGNVNTANRSGFVQGITNARNALSGNLHGIDWDIESGSSFPTADVVWISSQLKSLYGDGFAITMAPNGSNADAYRGAAVQMHNAGCLDNTGQQFYDVPVSLAAAKGRISQMIGAGIPQSKISVGMMISASNGKWWTNEQCRSYYTDIRNTWPGIQKAYLWEASRAGTSEWVSDMVRING